MIKNSTSKFNSWLYVCFIVLAFSACHSDKGVWSTFKPLNEVDKHVVNYYNQSMPQSATSKQGNPSIFVDFSDGIIQAYSSNAQNKEIISSLAQKLADKNDWYGLGKSYNGIGKLEFVDDRDLFNKVTTPGNYVDLMAPIEKAIEKIVANNNDAILITDFEEYTPDGKEQAFAYAKKYFIEWLNKGNSITFFYTKYKETNTKSKLSTNKNLYYTVFTYGNSDESGLKFKFIDALKGRSVAYQSYDLNPNPYVVKNEYGGNENTGLKSATFSKFVNANINGFVNSKQPFEFIGLNKAWNDDLKKQIDNYVIKVDDGQFIGKLFLNVSNQQAYQLNKLKVVVTDISEDFEKFARSNEALKHSPVLTKDAGKNNVWDENSKKDPITKACFDQKTNQLKSEWVYAPSDLSKNEWAEVFDINTKIFTDHLKNDPANVELITILHSNYKLKNIKKEDALIRIDYVIDHTVPNISSTQLNDFKWVSAIKKETGENNSLYESVRNALQEIKPRGVVYSYFIKLKNNKKESEK